MEDVDVVVEVVEAVEVDVVVDVTGVAVGCL